MVAPSTIDDLQTIVKVCHSSLEPLCVKLTGLVYNMSSIVSYYMILTDC